MSLKGHVFDKQLFSNQMYALFQDTFLDGESGILPKFKKSGNNEGMSVYSSGRQLFIRNGAACICGRFVEETDSSYELTNLLPEGNNYCILVIEIDLSKVNTTEQNGFKQAYYRILSDANAYPILTQHDITNTNLTGIYQFELARFQTTSSAITTLSTSNAKKLDIQSVYEKFQGQMEDLISALTTEINQIDHGYFDGLEGLKMYRIFNNDALCSLPANWENEYRFIEIIYGKTGRGTTNKSTGLIFYDILADGILCDSIENIYNPSTKQYTMQLYTGRIEFVDSSNIIQIAHQSYTNISGTSVVNRRDETWGQWADELIIKEVRLYKGYWNLI